MLRKVFVLIVSLVYLAFTTGITLQWHYCMNRLVSLRFAGDAEKRCGFCGMEKKDSSSGCCKDERSTYRISDDQQADKLLQFTIPDLPAELHFRSLLFSAFLSTVQKPLISCDHGPPGKMAVPLYLRYDVFRL